MRNKLKLASGFLLGVTLACGGTPESPRTMTPPAPLPPTTTIPSPSTPAPATPAPSTSVPAAPAPVTSTPPVAPAAPAPALATGLDYTDPTDTGWRLVKDASSTPTRLVLDLVGPSGLMTRGAGFNLVAPASVHYGLFTETNFPVKDTGVYELLNSTGTGDPLEPVLLAGGVKPGHLLTVGVFQKDRRVTSKDSGVPLFQIALEFDATANLTVGQALPLQITKTGYIPDDIGAGTIATPQMKAKSHLVPMTIALGSLQAQ